MTPVAAIAQSGLTAATQRLNVSASNLVNANDTSAVGGSGAYQPTQVQDSALPNGGVIAQAVTVKPASLLAFRPRPQPTPRGWSSSRTSTRSPR